MSSHYFEKISCPKCGAEVDIALWRSINTMLDPEMKEKVRTGEIFIFNCPKCGGNTNLVYPLLYHQMEDEIMIYLVSPEEVNKTVEMFQGPISPINDGLTKHMDDMEKTYKYRVVSSINQFKEKLMILDDKLDDRIVEIMKVVLRMYISKNENVTIQECFYDSNGGEPCFAVSTEEGWGTIQYDEEMYNNIAELYKKQFQEEKVYLVDYDWAVSILTNEN